MAQWRDRQIATSQTIAQGDKIVPPATPVKLPSSATADLPYDESLIPLECSTAPGKGVYVRYLSAWDGEQTAIWLVKFLVRSGYRSDENMSAILDGVDYRNDLAAFPLVHVKVSVNSYEQCTIELDAQK